MRRRQFGMHKSIVFILIAFFAIILGYSGYRIYELQKTKHNHNLIYNYINQELTYRLEMHDAERAQLEEYANWTNIYDADKGWVYERLSLIYQSEGDTVKYYDALGKALYYLESGENYDNVANIYADLANYYLTHNELDMAQDMLNRIYSTKDVESLSSGQIISYIYRLQGILDTENNNYGEALSNLNKSMDYIYKDEESQYYGESYDAITSVALASCYFSNGDYDKCREIIDKYEDSPFFTATEFEEILARDFRIPYYRVAINMTVTDNDTKRTDKFLHNFIDACKKYGYRNIELSQLTYMQKNMPTKVTAYKKEVDDEINNCYDAINKDLYKSHAILIDSQISFSRQNEHKKTAEEAEQIINLRNSIFILLGMGLLIVILFNVLFQNTNDALTKVGSRRALNRKLNHYSRTGQQYTVIMMDIDNFKHVNDTYGHEKGDEVLSALGKILKDEQKGGYKPFRYGGEEFLIFIDGFKQNDAIQKAERIRIAMSNQTWPGIDGQITISLGVAALHHSGEDVVKCADDNLYYSKQHGKNVVTYSDHGDKSLYTVNQPTSATHSAE